VFVRIGTAAIQYSRVRRRAVAELVVDVLAIPAVVDVTPAPTTAVPVSNPRRLSCAVLTRVLPDRSSPMAPALMSLVKLGHGPDRRAVTARMLNTHSASDSE